MARVTRPSVRSIRDLRAIAVPAYGPTLLGSVGSGAVIPVITLSALAMGASVSVAALVAALIGIGSLIGDLPAGELAHRIGERSALLIACALEFSGGLVCLAGIRVGALALLAVGVLMIGLAGSLFGLARQAWLTEAVPVELRARALSLLGGVNRIGLLIGPFLGALVVRRWGVSSAYAVDVLASIAAFVLIARTYDITAGAEGGEPSNAGGPVSAASPDGVAAARRQPQGQPQRPGRPQGKPQGSGLFRVMAAHRATLLTVGIGVLLVSLVRATRNVVVPLWAAHLGLDASHASLVVGISAAADVALFYPSGAVMDRRGRTAVAVTTMVLLGAGLVALPLTSSLGQLICAAVLLGIGNGTGSGLVMTLGADASPDVGRAQFLGGWRLMADLGSAGGPVLLSAIASIAALGPAILVIAGLSFVGAAWLRIWTPRHEPMRG